MKGFTAPTSWFASGGPTARSSRASAAPGPQKLAKDREIGNPNWRTRIKTSANQSTETIGAATGPHAYEASFRAGGGMAIAALALASTMPEDGDFSRARYLSTAEGGLRVSPGAQSPSC